MVVLAADHIPPRDGEGDRPKGGGGGPKVLSAPIKQVKRARRLRRVMTLPEVLLWQALRKRPGGLKFRRQFPIAGLPADFACLEKRLILEIDGETHSRGDQPRRDVARDALLQSNGFSVLRIPAREVLQAMSSVIEGIIARCDELGPLHQPAAGPPPRSGEEK